MRGGKSGRPSPFALAFNVPEHADVLLNVYTHEPSAKAKKRICRRDGKNKNSTAPVARSYHCHSVILAASSGYFKAQLSSAWQQQRTTPPDGCGDATMRVVDIHAEAEELEALDELLKMMYSLVLPEAAAPSKPLFLQCLALADQLEAMSCMELLVEGATAPPGTDVDRGVLVQVFQACQGMCASPSYPALLASCQQALVRLFGDVAEIINDDLMQQFCALPHAAVLAWAQSDKLRVDSENCVVFLVSAWVKANPDSTAEQLEELAHQIRVFHLGPTYLHQIVPSLSWFKGCSGMKAMPALLSCIHCTDAGGVPASNRDAAAALACVDCPPQWTAPPRLKSPFLRRGSWLMSPSQIRQAASGLMISFPSPVYVNGFLFKTQVQQHPAASGPGMTMGLSISVDAGAMRRQGVPWSEHGVVQVQGVKARVGKYDAVGYTRSKRRSLGKARLLSGSLGRMDFMRKVAASFEPLVAPYLQDGQLRIKVTFTAVDPSPPARVPCSADLSSDSESDSDYDD